MKILAVFAMVLLFVLPTSADAASDKSYPGKPCKKLAEDYRLLLGEKRDFEENKSYQKRKIKRKYKHRPYMRKLIEGERAVDEKLILIRRQIDKCEKNAVK